MNDAALVVRLEARLNTFERQLKQAGVLADQQARGIEERFSRSNLAIGTALGTGLGTIFGRIASEAPARLIQAVQDLAERFKNLQETAKRTGLELQTVFGIQQDAAQFGVSTEETNKGLNNLARLLDRAQRGEENSLQKLFSANDIDVSKIRDVGEAYRTLADLVQNAGAEIQKLEIAQMGGFGPDAVAALERGGTAIANASAAAAAGAPDLQRLGELAKEFDDAWKQAVDAVKTYFLENFGALRNEIADFVRGTARELEALGNAMRKVGSFVIPSLAKEDAPFADTVQAMDKAADQLRSLGDPVAAARKAMADRMSAMKAVGASTMTSDNWRPGTDMFGDWATPVAGARRPGNPTADPSRRTTRLPDLARSRGGGSSGPDPERFFDRQLERTRERSEDIELETRMLGRNTEERIKAKAALDLQQAARRGEITLTGEQMAALEREAGTLGRVTAEYEAARQRMGQNLSLQNYAGNELINVLDRIGQKGTSVGDIIDDLTRSLVRAAAQSLILGQGPFAGVFGTAAAAGSGNVGGLIGLIAGGFGIGRNAAGTSNWRGGPTWVGENGPEIINLPRGAQVIPNNVARQAAGGATFAFSPVTHMDMRGSNLSMGHVQAALDARDAELQRTFGERFEYWRQHN